MFFACTERQVPNCAIVSGILWNYEGKKVGLYSSNYVPIGDKSEPIHKELKFDANGNFVDTLYLEKGRDFSIAIERSFATIHLKPGDDLNIIADGNDLETTIKFSGSAAPIANYLLKYEQLFTTQNEQYTAILKLDESEFKKEKEAYENSICQALESTDGLTGEFIAAQKRDLHYGMVSSYLNHAERHGDAIEDENYKSSPNFLDIVSTVDLNDAKELKRSLHYGLLLKKYYTVEYAKTGDFYEEDKVKFVQFLEDKITDPIIKEELLYLYGQPIITSTKEVELCYEILNRNISNEEYKASIEEKYNQLKVTQPGQDSPTFNNYQNVDGGTNSLSDFRGKYVYIDIWATWCGPCKAEFPYLKEVEQKYHQNKNIVFISLSIDTQRSVEQWKTYVKENKLGGVQLITDNDRKSDFIANYQIEGIPRFILIDPTGKIVSADAPRPSDKALIELFDELGI